MPFSVFPPISFTRCIETTAYKISLSGMPGLILRVDKTLCHTDNIRVIIMLWIDYSTPIVIRFTMSTQRNRPGLSNRASIDPHNYSDWCASCTHNVAFYYLLCYSTIILYYSVCLCVSMCVHVHQLGFEFN